MDFRDIAVVLVEPQQAGNVGSAARAMTNMGLRRLLLVRPVKHLTPPAYRMALAGKEILEKAEVYESLDEALSGFGFVVGTTRREGGSRREKVAAHAAVPELVRLCSHNRCAVVFGREDSGLKNSEVELCHRLITIPASPGSESLNLAQAVMLVAYEIFQAAERSGAEGITAPSRKLASTDRLEQMYAHMETILGTIGYLHDDNPERMMRVFRRIFARAGLDEREVRAIRGIFRQMDWYVRNGKVSSRE